MQSIERQSQRNQHGGILFLLSSLIVGGSERKAIALANTLFARGWDVRIAYIDAPERSPQALMEMIAEGVPVFCLGRRGKYSVPALLRLARYLKQHPIARLVTVNLHPLVYAIPAVLTPGVARPRLVSMVNTMYSHKAGPGVMPFYGRLLRHADHAIFGSRSQMQSWIDVNAVDPSAATCIYNGIDLARFPRPTPKMVGERAAAEDQAPKHFTVGTVAQLRPEKNLRELLTATAQLIQAGKPIHVLIIGDGPERPALEAFASAMGIHEHVTFVGQVDDVRPYLAAMDVFVLTSIVETFSNAALEAMAMGRPVVLSRVGGAAEMVTPGVEGYLYTSGHPEELAVAVDQTLADDAKRKAIGENARQRVEQQFSWDRMVKDYENVIGVGPTATAVQRAW